MRSVFLLAIALALSVIADDMPTQPQSTGTMQSQQLSDGVQMNWIINSTSQTIIVQFSVACTCWIAIGWHSAMSPSTQDGMTDADMVLGVLNTTSNKVDVQDRWSFKMQTPSIDTAIGGKNDIMWYTSSQIGGMTTIMFERKLVTNDSIADNPITNDALMFIWAHGDTTTGDANELSYHGSTNKGMVNLNFFSGASQESTDNLPIIHGSLMFISFAICMSLGIFVARYLKEYYWWFPLHWVLQGLGVCLALVGFILALIMTDSGSHFSSVHSWFGFATLAFGFLAPILGWASDLIYDPARSGIPVWPDKLHHWTGRLTVLIAYVTIALGINLYGAPTAFMVIYCAIPCLYLSVYLFLEVYLLLNQNKVK